MELLTIKGLQREVERLENQKQHLEISTLFTPLDKLIIVEYYDKLLEFYNNAIAVFTEVIDPKIL